MYFRCLLPVAVEMLFMSTASGSRVGFHIYCHFLVAVEVAVEVAVAFQSGSRKESGSRKVNDLDKVHLCPKPGLNWENIWFLRLIVFQ